MRIPNSKRRILVVDDDPRIIEVVVGTLSLEGYQVEAESSGKAALKKIKTWMPHVILLDVNMPEMSGLEILEKLRRKTPYVSIMFLSGNSRTEDVVLGLDTGADDYIRKPFDPRELCARVRTQLRIKDLHDELREANARLKELVDTDDLTELFNMRSLYNRLDQELERGRRFGRSVCAVMMDMDHFKTVNDCHDHLFGSFVLKEVGKIIKNNIRSIDFAARYGGDEFLIILTELEGDGAAQFCERLRKKIEENLFDSGEDQIQLTASLGFALSDPYRPKLDGRSLVRSADRALYDAKEGGRNRVCRRDPALSEEV